MLNIPRFCSSAMDVAGDKRTPGRPKENPSTKAAEPSMSHESSENVPPKEEIDDSDPRGWVRGLLGENMKVYQSMHPVDFMEWNPRLLACALASKKGEVSIRRVQAGKVGWRVELSGETGLMWSDDSTLRQATTTLLAMCWSPDGDLLACSMNSGLVHYLDVESGRIKFTLRIEKPLHLIKWFRIEDLSALHFADYDHLALCKAPDFVVNKTDHREETQEMKDLESFVNETLPKALVGTVLVGARSPEDGAVVEAYAAGVMSIAQIKTDLSELRPRSIDIDPTTLEVQDVHVDPANHKPRRLWVSYRAIGVGKPSYDSEFGSITPDPHRKAYGYYTFVYGYDVRFGDFEYMSNVMGIAKRQTLLFHSVVLLQEMYAYMAKDWHLQSNIFQNRLKTEGNDNTLVNRPVVDYCSNLLDVILTGQMSTVVFQHLHEVSKEGIIKQMHKFLDERYGELIRILAGPLTTTGNTIHYQILQLLEEFVAFKDSDRLVNSFESIPDIASYPFELNLEAPEEIDFSTQRALRQAKEAAILLGRRIFEAKIVSFANRKDLKMLVRFLSICPPLFQAARTNQKESLFKSNDTYDTKTLINYIIATFGDYVDCDNEAIREKTPDPLEQILVKLKQIGTPPAESQENRPHENAIHARAVDPCLDRINDYFADKNDLPKELTLEPGWTPMWQEHHNIDMEEYDKLKDKNRSLKDAMMHMRKMFVELTKFVSEQLRSCDSNPEMIFVELCHPTGFTKIVLTSWEHASIPESISRKNPLRIDVDEERNRVQETAFGISQDVPRIVLIGKRETTEAKDGIIRTFAFAKDGTKIPMAHIGSPNPEVEMEDLRVGIKPWDNLMRKFIIDFQYFKEGILYGIVKFPENDTDHFIFKSSIFDRRGFVETEMTKARKIEKVAFSPDAQVGITIVPPFSRNTTSAKVLIFEGK
ncbi:hypothetical protein L596_006984 [Steinernema carpocapsae]|uniref:Anaphase-promoting complex subunit 4-like WD40 domain-containing protein n=1 Tax=Steinernema carpocapsae TaxID=34508 RepID=A0A4U5P8K5_STECR|nr:hypothetical protein L596_006984 [Steinernema carpocapsae]